MVVGLNGKSKDEFLNEVNEKFTIEQTDKKIDEKVYKLYGLTQEEIKIVENNPK